jgi:hypothetical protein
MDRNKRDSLYECDRIQRERHDTESREWSWSIHDRDLRNGETFEKLMHDLRKVLKLFPANFVRCFMNDISLLCDEENTRWSDGINEEEHEIMRKVLA